MVVVRKNAVDREPESSFHNRKAAMTAILAVPAKLIQRPRKVLRSIAVALLLFLGVPSIAIAMDQKEAEAASVSCGWGGCNVYFTRL
jgi:hypothetical protein